MHYWSKSNGNYVIKDFGILPSIFSISKYFRWQFQLCPSFFSYANIPDKWKRGQTLEAFFPINDNVDKSNNVNKSDNVDKNDNIGKSGNVGKSDNVDKSDNVEKTDNVVNVGKSDNFDKSDNVDKSDNID